jgi:hypothetical protein
VVSLFLSRKIVAASPVGGEGLTRNAELDAQEAVVSRGVPDPMLAGQAGGEVLVNTLRVDTLTDPIGLGDAAPMLSWRLSSARQTAYQIQVASSMARLRQPDLWDSGKVSSSDSSNVVYAGAVPGVAPGGGLACAYVGRHGRGERMEHAGKLGDGPAGER